MAVAGAEIHLTKFYTWKVSGDLVSLCPFQLLLHYSTSPPSIRDRSLSSWSSVSDVVTKSVFGPLDEMVKRHCANGKWLAVGVIGGKGTFLIHRLRKNELRTCPLNGRTVAEPASKTANRTNGCEIMWSGWGVNESRVYIGSMEGWRQ